MNAARKQRVWTPTQRQEQSRKLRERQIWLKSTGPKTETGKSISSRNARKADYEERMAERTEMKQIIRYLRTQKSYTDLINFYTKQQDRMHKSQIFQINLQFKKLENELRDLEAIFRSGQKDEGNIIPFPNAPP